MQSLTVKTKIVCFIFLSALGIQAQQPASQGPATAGAVPRLVRFAGSFHAPAGQPAGPIGATFAIYNEPEGGTPLWTEEQNVELDAAGNYSVLLGSTKNEGVPAELFGANDPRWLQVKFNVPDAVDAPRVLLVSVPYALKAVDADTLGGKPASAYLMAAPSASVQRDVAAATAAATTAPAGAAPVKRSARPENVISGTMGRIPYFYDTTSDLGNSVMYQSSAGNIGIGTTSPGNLLTVQTAATGYTFLENLYGSVDPGVGATRLEVGNPVSTLMLTAYGSGSPGILGGSAGVVSLAGPLLVGNAAAGKPLYLYAGNNYTAPQFTLLATGSVGIGTQNPGATLEVNGSAKVDGSVTATGSVSGASSTVGGSGVTGNNTATSGSGTNGVSGNTSSPNGVGVAGMNLSNGGHGVYGSTNGTSTNNPAGVYGTAIVSSTSVPTYGVYGTTASSFAGSAGVYGTATATTSSETYGVYGTNPNVDDFGVGVAGTGTTISGEGGIGNAAGVWGDASGTTFSMQSGVIATADNGYGVYAQSNGTGVATLFADNQSTTTSAVVFGTLGGGSGTGGFCTINVIGQLNCSGTITPSAQTSDGRQVKLYTVASPENWFEDFGSGQLAGGSAQIPLDPIFASTVNTGEPYHVFLTPNGDCKGLYVASKTASGFEVRELGGGASSISFDYRIVAKRRGYESARLEDVTDQANEMRQRNAEMQARRTRKISAPPSRPH